MFLSKRCAAIVVSCLLFINNVAAAAAGPPESSSGYATPPAKRADLSPTVQLDNATFIGTSDGTVDKFLGMPYVKPPYVSPPTIYVDTLANRRTWDISQHWRSTIPPSDSERPIHRNTRSHRIWTVLSSVIRVADAERTQTAAYNDSIRSYQVEQSGH